MINSKLDLFNGIWDNGKFLGKKIKRGITIIQFDEIGNFYSIIIIVSKLKTSKVDTRIWIYQ